MYSLDRRKFCQSAACAGVIPVATLYPQPANAWIWFVARALFSFAGRTVGRQAVRTAIRSGARASRPVKVRTTGYVNRVKPIYRSHKTEYSYPFAEFAGKELGQYGAESTFDYLYNLNNSHYGGAESTVVYDQNRPDGAYDGGVGYSTGDRANKIADFHISHVMALDLCSKFLEESGFINGEITGLLYPVTSAKNTFSSSRGYTRLGPTSYKTAFGRVSINSYKTDRYRADLRTDDDITGRHFKWKGVPL